MTLPQICFVNAGLLTLNLDVFTFIVYVNVSFLKVCKIYLREDLVVFQPNACATVPLWQALGTQDFTRITWK